MHQTRNIAAISAQPEVLNRGRTARRQTAASPYALLAAKIFSRVKVHLLIYILSFYILPVMMSSAGQQSVLLAFIFPAVLFILCASYGFKYGFMKHYIAVPLILFLPASFLIFKAYSFLFSLCYLLILCIALTIGALYRQFLK